jgi:Concanavalin A-like lectin/glucanases superfamily
MAADLWNRRDFMVFARTAGLASLGIPHLYQNARAASEKRSAAYRAKVLAKHPVAYWRLGEAHGPTAHDDTGHGHQGTYHGPVAFHQPGAIAGDPNRAVKLPGQAYIEVPDSVDFSQPGRHPERSKGLTVEAWLQPDTLVFPGQSADPYIHWLGKGEAGRFEWAFRFYSKKSARPNRISAYIFNAAGGEGAGAYFQDELVAGEWIHMVACYEPGDKDSSAGVQIYKNGKLRKGPPSKGTLYKTYGIVPAHGSAPLRLGTRDLKSFLVGGLDEVAVYPRVLAASEILENYRAAMAE